MYKNSICILFLLTLPICAMGSDFAARVTSYNGPFGPAPYYNDPCTVLGKPTRWIRYLGETYACSMVFPAFNTDPNGKKLIVTVKEGAKIVVRFDHRVADDAGNPYGIDFIVFGNSFFVNLSNVTPNTNMEEYFITEASVNEEPVLISVAQQSGGPWYSFASGPYGDTVFPTNAFEWDRNAHKWGTELDWLKPVDPLLDISSFGGLSVADAIDLYDGSAGGTGFDLEDLDPDDYAALAVDPNTGRKWIQYIKVEYLPGGDYEGEIDGFSDVAGGGDYQHPAGDIDISGKVDYKDVALLRQYWLVEPTSRKDIAGVADIYQDGIVNLYDFALLADNWQK